MENHKAKELKRAILARSESDVWELAKAEWLLDHIYETEEPGTCLCTHFPIIEHCVLINRLTLLASNPRHSTNKRDRTSSRKSKWASAKNVPNRRATVPFFRSFLSDSHRKRFRHRPAPLRPELGRFVAGRW